MGRGRLIGISALALSLGALAAAPAVAQTVTASVRGTVTGAQAGSAVTATSVDTNRSASAPVGANGGYVLTGLRPGSYDVTVVGSDGQPRTQRVTIGIGQTATLDIDAAAPVEQVTVSEGEEIVVTGNRLFEVRTSEVATNVSTTQIRNLPQTDRNFLSFAALAPGVRYNDGEFGKGFSAGASNASDVNLFIDGLSYKNNVLAGGIAGQGESRGNPFPQLAVSEFRVLTQNYKAEYEQASSAVIVAATRSGTNEFHGEAFGQYTDRGLTAQDIFSKRAGAEEPQYERRQYGVSLGGPIIRDRLFFFAAYEGNDQTRAYQVRVNGLDQIPTANGLRDRLAALEGFYDSPFNADLYFGKLTWTPDERQTFDLSVNVRREADIRNFQLGVSYEAATAYDNRLDTYLLRHTYRGDGFVNEAAVSYLDYNFQANRLFDLPTFNYSGFIQAGGATDTRDVIQRSFTIRDDLTLSDIDWNGSHVVKIGARFASQKYDITSERYAQPYYEFRRYDDLPTEFTVPFLANLGLGDPRIRADNFQIGLYVQDDWEVNDRLTLNIGLRWDYEDNLFNNDFVTPPNVADVLRALPTADYFRDPERFISDGKDRPADFGMFQPRLGFSYDLNGDQRTVFFGGYGRYYDRNVFSNTLEERFRLQYDVGTYYFSPNGGLNQEGTPTIPFRPEYLTREGLEGLRASAQLPLLWVYVLDNELKAPRSDQFTLGIRQRIGDRWQASLSGTYQRQSNNLANLFVNRDPVTGDCCVTGPGTPAGDRGFSYVTVVTDDLSFDYKAIYATLDKPYSDADGWGLNIAYTLGWARQNGDAGPYGAGGFNSFNCLTTESCGWSYRDSDVRHQIVASGQVLLPFGIRVSTLTTLRTGQPYQFEDYTNGFSYSTQQVDFDRFRQDANCLGVFARCTVDIKLQKEVALFGGDALNLYVDVFNLFNNRNYRAYDGYINGYEADGTTPLNPTYRQPLDLATRPRSVQFGASYRF